jgi:hypothetical protein
LSSGNKSLRNLGRSRAWRYVIGTFQVKVPVATAATLLRPEEDTLAIMRWRLQQTSPASRWHPVLTRYISYIADRVGALGGDPSAIPPSPTGAPLPVKDPCGDTVEFRGRISEVLFDCLGDVEGSSLRIATRPERSRRGSPGWGNLPCGPAGTACR